VRGETGGGGAGGEGAGVIAGLEGGGKGSVERAPGCAKIRQGTVSAQLHQHGRSNEVFSLVLTRIRVLLLLACAIALVLLSSLLRLVSLRRWLGSCGRGGVGVPRSLRRGARRRRGGGGAHGERRIRWGRVGTLLQVCAPHLVHRAGRRAQTSFPAPSAAPTSERTGNADDGRLDCNTRQHTSDHIASIAIVMSQASTQRTTGLKVRRATCVNSQCCRLGGWATMQQRSQSSST
jgi:hypothetical protein